MAAQDVLTACGVALMLAAVACGVVAARTYVTLDIRGVRDDLSGRARRRELERDAVLGASVAGATPLPPAAGGGEDAIVTRLGEGGDADGA